MSKLCIIGCSTVLGSIGWWLGEFVGLMTAFVLGSVGSAVGVYVGWRIAQEHFE